MANLKTANATGEKIASHKRLDEVMIRLQEFPKKKVDSIHIT